MTVESTTPINELPLITPTVAAVEEPKAATVAGLVEAPLAAPVTAPVAAPILAPLAAPVSAPIATPSTPKKLPSLKQPFILLIKNIKVPGGDPVVKSILAPYGEIAEFKALPDNQGFSLEFVQDSSAHQCLKELGNVSALFTVEKQRPEQNIAAEMSAYILGAGDEHSLPHSHKPKKIKLQKSVLSQQGLIAPTNALKGIHSQQVQAQKQIITNVPVPASESGVPADIQAFIGRKYPSKPSPKAQPKAPAVIDILDSDESEQKDQVPSLFAAAAALEKKLGKAPSVPQVKLRINPQHPPTVEADLQDSEINMAIEDMKKSEEQCQIIQPLVKEPDSFLSIAIKPQLQVQTQATFAGNTQKTFADGGEEP